MDESAEDRRARLQRRANDAIWTHHTWVNVLRRAIAERRCAHSLADVADTQRCDIGRWLADEFPAELQRSERYRTSCEIHARFHEEAAAVLGLALDGASEAASASMASGGRFFLAAANMRSILYEWATALQPE